jgi:carboxyl-terminal processing protease
VTVTVLRGQTNIDFNVTRRAVVQKTVKYTIDENKIACIKITSFKDNTTQLFKEAVDSAERDGAVAIIFDLRSNLGGYLHAVTSMLSYLVPEGTRIVSYYDTYTKKEVIDYATDNHTLTIPCAVLCNNYTASAAELFTSALRDYNDMGIIDATIIGTNTYGKGVMQDVFSIGGGCKIKLTMAYYNPPCDKNYDGVGVIPDVAVENSDNSVDLVFNTATDFLMKKLEIAN